MPFYIRKAFNINKFFKINLSKSGLGWSFGRTGIRFGQKPDGQTYVHGGRYGLYFRENIGKIVGGGMVISFVMLFVLSGVLSHTGIGNEQVGFNSRGEEVHVGSQGGRYVMRNGKKVYGSAAIVSISNNSSNNADFVIQKTPLEETKQREALLKEIKDFYDAKRKAEAERDAKRRSEYTVEQSKDFLDKNPARAAYLEKLYGPCVVGETPPTP